MRTKWFAGAALLLALSLAGAAWAGVFSRPAKPTAGTTCCYPGSPCCYPGSPCCEDGDCCFPGSPCCDPPSACCSGGKAAAKKASCADGHCCSEE
jgi:hypothetical protein